MQQELMTTSTDPDLSGMDYRQLSALRDRIDDRVRDMRETQGLGAFAGILGAGGRTRAHCR